MSIFVIDRSTTSTDGQDKRVYRLMEGKGAIPGAYFQDNREGMKKIVFTSHNVNEVVNEAIRRGANPDNCSWPGHKAGEPIINPVNAIAILFSRVGE